MDDPIYGRPGENIVVWLPRREWDIHLVVDGSVQAALQADTLNPDGDADVEVLQNLEKN